MRATTHPWMEGGSAGAPYVATSDADLHHLGRAPPPPIGSAADGGPCCCPPAPCTWRAKSDGGPPRLHHPRPTVNAPRAPPLSLLSLVRDAPPPAARPPPGHPPHHGARGMHACSSRAHGTETERTPPPPPWISDLHLDHLHFARELAASWSASIMRKKPTTITNAGREAGWMGRLFLSCPLCHDGNTY